MIELITAKRLSLHWRQLTMALDFLGLSDSYQNERPWFNKMDICSVYLCKMDIF